MQILEMERAYEYNYSRQNEGGCVMFCLDEAIHNTFSQNVSYDDLGGILSPSGNPDAFVSENIFYVREGCAIAAQKSRWCGNVETTDSEQENQII